MSSEWIGHRLAIAVKLLFDRTKLADPLGRHLLFLNPIRLLSACRFSGRLCQFGEGRGILQGDVRQNLSVEIDSCHLQAMNKLVVVESVLARCSADADNPQLSELALADSSVAIGVAQRLFNGLFRRPVKLALIEVKPLGKPQQLLPAIVPFCSTFNSRHSAL